MKNLKTSILSVLLAFVAVLTLLLPAASAATSTGSGITSPPDSEYTTTRINSNGQAYYYCPPMAAGKRLFCCDLGYSYLNGLPSFLNSYTYTSATGTDADTVLKDAIAKSGLSEADAAALENIKWMMSFIADYTGSVPGALFMAVQTYVWDHQTDKSAGGDPSGDIDAGGFINADTYEAYVEYYNWMLSKKAGEDAELLAKVQEYANQGVQASIVEDTDSKWAVLAMSDVPGRQSFFAYHANRKVVTRQAPMPEDPGGPEQPTTPDHPVAGDGTIMFRKVAAGTTQGLDGAVYNIYRDGQIIGSQVTSGGGYIKVEGITTGLYTFVEREAPAGYALDPTPHSVYVDVTDGGKQYTVTAEDEKLPSLRIVKTDARTGAPIPGTVFSIKSVTDGFSTSVTTGEDGTASLDNLDVGVYVVKEESVPEPYIVSQAEQTVALRPGKTSEVIFQNYQKPGLEILKKNIANGTPIPNVTFLIRQIDGNFSTSATTDAQGRIFLENIPVGSYEVVEIAVPSHVIPGDIPQTAALEAGGVATVTFFNALKPTLTIRKVDSITGDTIQGVKFRLWRASDNTSTGELNDLGVFYTDERGEIVLEHLESGWYKATELEPADGYELPKAPSQEFYLKGGESKTVVFENVPLSALVIWKYDSVTGGAVKGAVFQIKYLNGSSGTGGTVIGTYKTSANGSFTVTGLKKGTYIVTEIASNSGHVIDTAPQTVYISGEEQNVIELFFGNSPKGAVLIKKIDSATREPLADVEFYVTDSSGEVLGDANGKFITDSAGTILIDGIDPGTTLVVKETRTLEGYILDDVPQTVQIKAGQTVTLEFRNAPMGRLIIHKLDSVTKKPLVGVQFKVTYANGQVVDAEGGKLSSNGLYTTDSDGQIKISGITGTLVVTEVQTVPGYTIDENTRSQTVVVNANDTQSLAFYNEPLCSLTLYKRDSATGEPLAGAQFLVTDQTGAPVGASDGHFTTGSNGLVTVTGLTPGMALTVREEKAPSGYALNTEPQTIVVQSGQDNSLTFDNAKKGTLIILKLDCQTNEPVAGAEFKITTSGGELVADREGAVSSNGMYVTDANGEIRITGLDPDTFAITETTAPDGYVLDNSPHMVEITANDTQTVRIYNTPTQTLTIQKYVDGTTVPIRGVTFLVTDSSGQVVGPNNGEYVTDRNGRIVITGLTPGTTITAREIRPASGYVLDATPQSILIKSGTAQSLTFFNKAKGGLELIKVNEADRSQRIPNTTFEIRRMDGGLVDTIATDSNGRVYAVLESGDYYAVEIKAAYGFQPDNTPHYFTVRDGKITTLTVTNKPLSGLLIHKIDSNTKKGIPGATFLVFDENSNPIAQISTDQNGYAWLERLNYSGLLYLRELENDGYIVDTQLKMVYVTDGQTTLVQWENTPVTGQIQIYKYAAEYNGITGTPAGAPLQGAVYEISEARSGKVVDYITTDARGVAASKPLPLGRYKIVEVTAPAYWQLSGTTFDETLEYSGQIIKLSDYDKPISLDVTITKRGNAEVLVGSQMRYDFTVANTSNVALEDFHWHDRIPTDATRATVFTTGTYSERLNYRVLYKTNYTTAYQVLASNLLTTSNYSFRLNAIPMQAGEYITDICLDFGKVPVGFQSKTSPTLTVQVLGTVVNGYQIVNRADVGGKYQGVWQTAQASWVTLVRVLTPSVTPTLPKTGY